MSLFTFDSVSVAFGDRQVLKDFNLAISTGEKVVFRGASGSGKSTILRLLLGFCQADSGVVRFRGEALTPEVVRQVRGSVAWVSQSVELEPGNVEFSLKEMFSFKSSGACPSEDQIREAFGLVGLREEILDQGIQDLSGGERQRVALATAILLGRTIFLLDEPTAALDVSLKEQMADLFLNQPDWTVLTSAHDPVWFEERPVTLINLSS